MLTILRGADSGRKGFWNSFWNRAYDHKLYLQVDVPTVKGAQFGYKHTVTGFTVRGAQKWQDVAKAIAEWPAASSARLLTPR